MKVSGTRQATKSLLQAHSSTRKEIAYRDGVVSREHLPFPYVHYPGFYGTFFGFSETQNGPITLCSCALVPVENYIRYRLAQPTPRHSQPDRMFVLDSMDFPMRIVQELMRREIADGDLLSHLTFKDKLCHECNRATPSLKYCHEMYGGVFKQTYGWYINKQSWEYGLHGQNIQRDVCPQDILGLIEIEPEAFVERYRQLQEEDPQKAEELEKRYRKQQRRIERLLENEVRQKFGHKKVGEAWTSETILYYIVRKLLLDREILRHYRPDFMEGLELDIYVPSLRLAIEYQGVHHYRPVKHWGGEEALKQRRQRDKKKRNMCKALAINLVYFKYTEDLSDSLVESKLAPFMPGHLTRRLN